MWTNGLFLIGLPEPTVKLIESLAEKTASRFGDVIAEALRHYAEDLASELREKSSDKTTKPR